LLGIYAARRLKSPFSSGVDFSDTEKYKRFKQFLFSFRNKRIAHKNSYLSVAINSA